MADVKINAIVVLLVIDGWGIAPAGEGNAFSLALTPVFNDLALNYPITVLGSKIAHGRKDHSKYRCELGHMAIGGADPDRFLSGADPRSLPAGLLAAGVPVSLVAEAGKCGSLAYFFCGQSDLRPQGLAISVSADGDLAKETVGILGKFAKGLLAVNIPAIDIANMAGDREKTIMAVETADRIAGAIIKAALKKKATVIVTSDHGSAEAMVDMKTETPNRERTDDPVPFLVIGKEYLGKNLGWPDVSSPDLSVLKPVGTLYDVAPTIMHLFGLRSPEGWKGKSLI